MARSERCNAFENIGKHTDLILSIAKFRYLNCSARDVIKSSVCTEANTSLRILNRVLRNSEPSGQKPIAPQIAIMKAVFEP